MLLKEILKHTAKGSASEYELLFQALRRVTRIADYVNQQKKQQEQKEHLKKVIHSLYWDIPVNVLVRPATTSPPTHANAYTNTHLHCSLCHTYSCSQESPSSAPFAFS
jgi:hypothetical protein